MVGCSKHEVARFIAKFSKDVVRMPGVRSYCTKVLTFFLCFGA